MERFAYITLLKYFQLNQIDKNHKISDGEWSNIIRRAHITPDKPKPDMPLNVPGYWWLLVLGDRNPLQIKKIIEEHYEDIEDVEV